MRPAQGGGLVPCPARCDQQPCWCMTCPEMVSLAARR